MKQNEEDIYKIDVNKAWDTVFSRLEEDRLLTEETDSSFYRKRKIPLKWMAVAAAVVAGIFFSISYFPKNKDSSSLVFLQNKDNSTTLVKTLEDGSTVYLAGNASITYPAVFAKNKRKVEMSGNVLFCVTKDKKRPFVVKTIENITIEVVGTIFAVQSAIENPFELSVKQGRVNVHSDDYQTVVPVDAGETLQMGSNELIKSGTDNFGVFSCFTEKMRFKDEKLNNIIQAINSMYGFPAIIIDESLSNRTLTVTFENESVETMTELICVALNLERVNNQDTILIRQFLK